jgi:hypothetical protein
MRTDRNRVPGFYWVRFEGEVIVAEYTDGAGCLEEVGGVEVGVKPHWHVPGSDVCYKDREVCELLSATLETKILASIERLVNR